MDVKLAVISGGRTERTIPIGGVEFVIGRHPSCQFQVDSDRVSQRHCRILQSSGRVTIEDLKSTNGTLLNDHLIRTVEVQDGDRLKVGPMTFLVKISTDESDLQERADNWIAGALSARGGRPAAVLESATDASLVNSAREILDRISGRREQAEDRARVRVSESHGITVAKLLDKSIVEDLDIQTIGDELDALIRSGRNRIVLNFEYVEYLSSQAIGVVVKTFKRCKAEGGVMKVCRLSPQVAEIVSLMGLKRLIEILPDEESAILSQWPKPSRPLTPVQPSTSPSATMVSRATVAPPAPARPPTPAPKPAAAPVDRTVVFPVKSAAAPTRVRLLVATGKAKGQAIEIQLPRFVIGRDPRCHLKPNSPTISRVHTIIEQRDGRVFVRDQGTTNGTVLNDRMLKGEEAEAFDGDRIDLGPLQFTLEVGARTGLEPKVEAAAAQWLIDGPDANPEGSTLLFNTRAQPAGSSSEPMAPSDDSGMVKVHQVKYEVVRDVLVVTILTPDLNEEPAVGPIRYELMTLFEESLPRHVVISLEHVTYLSSRAVGVLLAHYQRLDRANGAMRVSNINPSVLAILNQMRLPMMIETFPSVDEAVLAPW